MHDLTELSTLCTLLVQVDEVFEELQLKETNLVDISELIQALSSGFANVQEGKHDL